MKKDKTLNKILGIVILLALFLLLMNPQIIPFLSGETQATIQSMLQSTFGKANSGEVLMFSVPKLITILAIIVFVLLVSSVIRFLIERSTLRGKRSRTVAGLVLSVLKYATVIVIAVWGLSVLGVNVTGIFASLGILSLIIGFGAQSLIEDIITGIFIIFEGQYNVGDIIVLDDFRGTVKRIGVRTTSVEDAGGNIKIVNNSDIRNLQNRSENPSYAVCDIDISYDVRFETVDKVFETGLPKIGEKYPDVFLQNPTFSGVQSFGDSGVVIRVIALVREENIFKAQRLLNREVKTLLDDNNIEIPFTQIVIHNAKD